MKLTQDYLRSIIRYDPKSGVFTSIVNRRHWKVGTVVGTTNGAGYRQIWIDGTVYLAHRLAVLYMVGILPKKLVDHKNGIRSDNRWCNLRPCTQQQNHQNSGMQSHNTSGVKGVHFETRRGLWVAKAKVLGKRHFIGYFEKLEDAALARQTYCKELHGKFYCQTT
jgi:AP2 domain.